MRHRNKGRILGRTKAPRQALFKNLAASLILYEKLKTTEAKAKEMRGYVERIITKGKINTLASRRLLLKQLPTENSVRKVLEVLSPRYKDRHGGYTRIVKLIRRKGDGAKIALIEFV
ncbi:MAG: 50S ribosomal protein L17 [Patescibacteria group bacterium]